MAKSRTLPAKLIHQFCDLAHSDRNLSQLQSLLQAHPRLLTSTRPGKDKETALGAAVHSYAGKTIRFLLSQGAARDIYVACAQKQYNEVDALLKESPKLVTARAAHIHNMDLVDLAPDQKKARLLIDRGYHHPPGCRERAAG